MTAPTCVACQGPIDVRRNYADGPRHVHCAFQSRTPQALGRRVDSDMDQWKRMLDRGAITGRGYRDATATLAERPERSAWWDYTDPDGMLRMPFVEIWARGCPGEPSPPGRFEDRLPCRYGHLHRPSDWGS